MAEKKPRKKRSDFGKKRGKRMKNPRLQTGSIDFRTIGTQQISNLTSLIGTMASLSRPIIQQPISTELSRYAPRDLEMRQMIPQPQERIGIQQAQEEEPSQTEQVRRAMGERIGRLRKEEAALFLKSKVSEVKNMLIGQELQINSQKLIENEGFLSKQKEDLIKGSNYLQKPELKRIFEKEGIDIEPTDDLTDLRITYLRSMGLKIGEDFNLKGREGARGKASKELDLIPIIKQDFQRAQEERPIVEIAELQED